MPAPTLTAMAQRACIRNLNGINDLADLPYPVVRPILRRITDPLQLRRIEERSPHIADADAELWKALIKRDIPRWEDKIMEPTNPRSWWKVYKKLLREEQRAKEGQEAALMRQLGGLEKEKEANQAQIIHRTIPQNSKGRTFVDGVLNPKASGWGGTKVPALGNAKSGKDVLGALKRQSALAHQQRGGSGSKIIPARAMLPSAKSQIRQAPKTMVMDHQKPAPNAALVAQARAARADSPPSCTPRIMVPKSGMTNTDKAINDAIRAERAEKEKRLRALTSVAAKTSASTTLASPVARPAATATSPPKAASRVCGDGRGAGSMGLAVRAGEKRKLSPSPSAASTVLKRAKKVDPFLATRRRAG